MNKIFKIDCIFFKETGNFLQGFCEEGKRKVSFQYCINKCKKCTNQKKDFEKFLRMYKEEKIKKNTFYKKGKKVVRGCNC